MVEGVALIAHKPQYRRTSLGATLLSARARRVTVRVTRRAAHVFMVVAQVLTK